MGLRPKNDVCTRQLAANPTVMVTASVSERDYNALRIGDPVRFRVAGTGREYAGTITKLGLTGTGARYAIVPEERHHQIAVEFARTRR